LNGTHFTLFWTEKEWYVLQLSMQLHANCIGYSLARILGHGMMFPGSSFFWTSLSHCIHMLSHRIHICCHMVSTVFISPMDEP